MLILEAAASSVAAILLAWLLLWFMRQRSSGLSVEAMYTVADGLDAADAPFPAVDARALLGGRPPRAAGADALVNLVRQQGPAAVVYVAAPTVGDGPDAPIGSTSIRALIEKFAREARRDVVLALDLAQIDSDRDLGVYGNSPYDGLAELVAQTKGGDHCVYVLTSAAPAQKSWGADGLGQSVFAYYLREGLEGKAQGWDAPALPGRTTVEGLHRYVESHVSRWAANYRNAVQTPMLLKIGGARTVTLPFRTDLDAVAIEEKAPPNAPKPEPPPASSDGSATPRKDVPAAAEASKAAPSPRDRAVGDLIDEWKRHDDLLKRRPYRELPASWRSYQAELMRIERRLRAAWNVDGALDEVDRGLKGVGQRRGGIEEGLRAARESNVAFPLRPARDDEEGRRAVAEALIHLTGAALEGGPFATPAPKPLKPPPAEPKEPKEPKAAGDDPPRPLVDALLGGFPEPYLELQLPAWALRFNQEFAVPDHFKDDRRGAILRRLVDVRARAEDALAVDRRGLDWIRPILALGDDQRRAAQDQLFGPDSTDDDHDQRLKGEIARFESNYDSALRVIRACGEARDAWEKAAAELPELAEWIIRARAGRASSAGGDSAAGPLMEDVERALAASADLADALDRPPPAEGGPGFLEAVRKPIEDLQAMTRTVQAAVDALERRLLDAARSAGPRDWRTLDAALRTPLIPWETRRRALTTVLEMEERLELTAAPADVDPAETAPDPGFRRLAVGLAALDLKLRRVARPDRRAQDPSSRFLLNDWADLDKAAPDLKAYGTDAAKARVDEADARERRRRERAKDRKAEDVGPGLRADDRAVRLLCAGAVRGKEPSLDSASRDCDAFADYQTLAFHVERLRRDHAANLASLQGRVDERAAALSLAPERGRAAGAGLRIVTTPPPGSPLRIGEGGTASLAVEIATPEEGLARSEPPPRGRAFVGMAVPPSSLRIRAEDAGGSGLPPGRLVEVGPAAQDAEPTRFTISQVGLENDAGAFKTAAKLFYRGRVDEKGTAVVDVLPRSFPNLVLVEIGQDPLDLEARFGKGAAQRIEDQFKKHPGEGYMHGGKDAAYVLTFKNVTFQKLTVAYKRTLVDPSGAAAPVPIDSAEREVVLPPEGAVQVAGKVTSLEAPRGQVRNLTVALRVKESKTPAPDFVVRFQQIDVDRYMNFEAFMRLDDFKGVRQQCYVVRFIRRADDPVREPIKGNELSCTINDQTSGPSDDFEMLPGTSIKTTSPYEPGKNQFSWSGRVENEVLKPRKSSGAEPTPADRP